MDVIQQDVDRLLHNQRNLLDVMPEMVLLVHGGSSIEYMNPSAISFFGDLRSISKQTPSNNVPEKAAMLFEIIRQSLNRNQLGIQQEINLNDSHLECILAPFEGYRGDLLHWLFLRDITHHKTQNDKSSYLNNNIETILLQEIDGIHDRERIRKTLSHEKNSLKDNLNGHYEDGTMVGSSKSLRELRSMVQQVAKSDATILITGESGTGKELVANMIRETSNRNNKSFLKINCNTINDSILESDLFGYEKGAFTGADTRRKGKFEVVDGGTIFLDEIGDISPRMQASLLRVLQDGEIIRVGGNAPIRVDVRIIAATNNDLPAAVQEGTFRLDLFYRLNIINIRIPPLRQRKEDIVDLVTHFVRRYRMAFKKDITFLPKSIMNRLIEHDWPGNVRELENVIQRAVLMSKSNVITENELFFDVQCENHRDGDQTSYLKRLEGMPLKDMIAELESEIISHTLRKNRGNVATTAQQLNIGKTAFYDKMKRYGINPKSIR
jgi:Nif-specific regulatory protein